MLPDLIEMHGIEDQAADPQRFRRRTAGHAGCLFGELAERRAVLLGSAGGCYWRKPGPAV